MSYGTGSDALLKTIRRESRWNSTNTSASEWDILNKRGDRFLILRPGEEFEIDVVSINGQTTRTPWSTVAEIWRKHTNSKDVRKLEDDVDVTLRKIEAYPHLGKGETGSIHMAKVASGGAIEERWSTSGEGPKWLVQELVVMWTEERRITSLE